LAFPEGRQIKASRETGYSFSCCNNFLRFIHSMIGLAKMFTQDHQKILLRIKQSGSQEKSATMWCLLLAESLQILLQ
jgi:hypothetical protein